MTRSWVDRAPRPLSSILDGNYINNKVGALAVIANGSITYRLYLGQASEVTVYPAELRGILLVLQIIYEKDYKAVIVFTDNQVVIRSMANPDN